MQSIGNVSSDILVGNQTNKKPSNIDDRNGYHLHNLDVMKPKHLIFYGTS